MVEVYDDNLWGLVCSTNWNMKSSQVACRQLGFPIVQSWNYASAPPSRTTKFLSTSASCNGSENALSQCINPVKKKTSCSGGKVVRLHCSSGMFDRFFTFIYDFLVTWKKSLTCGCSEATFVSRCAY